MAMGLRGLHRQLREPAEFAIAIANHLGLSPRVTSVYRSIDKQRVLYNRYQRALADGTYRQPGGVQYPAAPPGSSAHNFGLAWDSVVDPSQQALWNEIRRYVGWEVLSNDQIHAQYPSWREIVR